MTHDTQGVVNIVSKSQGSSFYGLGVNVFGRFSGNQTAQQLLFEQSSDIMIFIIAFFVKPTD